MLIDLAGQRRVLFFGGKGGVGKTTIAAAVALARAQAGSSVLLVSTDPAHSVGHLFGVPIGDAITEIAPGLDACELDPEQTMQTHLAASERTIRRLMPEHLGDEVAKHMALARAAPGAAEAAVVERLADVVEGARQVYDLVVIDTAPSGHTVRLLAMPSVVAAWTDDLLRRQERSQRFDDAVANLDRRDRDDDPGAGVVPAPQRRRGRGGRLRGGASTQSRNEQGRNQQDPGERGRSARGRSARGRSKQGRSERDAEIREVLLRRQARFRHLLSVITDQEATGFVVVLAAERLPVLETIDLHGHVSRLGANVSALVVNRRSPTVAGTTWATRREEENKHLAVLRKALPESPVLEVPLLPHEPSGCDGLADVIASL